MHQHYAEAVSFFGGKLADAAETSSFQVFFGDSTAHKLVTDVLGSLNAQSMVAFVGACGTIGCSRYMDG